MNDITSTEWFQLEMERDALDTERQKWAYERDKKLRPETEELDEKLERLDPERFASYKKLERQIWKIMAAVHEGMLDNDDDGFAAEELTVKKRQLYELGHENLTMEVRPCKWRRRHQISERMWHCTEEEIACEEKISRIEASQRKLKPEEPKEKTTFVFNPEDMDYEPDPADDFYTAEMAEIDELHFEIDTLKEAAEWNEMSSERQLRKKDQALHDMQTLGLLEYIDQLEGLLEEVNEDWKENVRRLDAEGDLTGQEIDVYFNGPHPKETFALRYREDLGSTPKWRVVVESKSGQNRYLVKQDFPPHKRYLMALGKDARGHIFAFSFLSTFGLDWFNAEKTMGLSKAKIRAMTTYDRYQCFDKLNEIVTAAKAKKRARG